MKAPTKGRYRGLVLGLLLLVALISGGLHLNRKHKHKNASAAPKWPAEESLLPAAPQWPAEESLLSTSRRRVCNESGADHDRVECAFLAALGMPRYVYDFETSGTQSATPLKSSNAVLLSYAVYGDRRGVEDLIYNALRYTRSETTLAIHVNGVTQGQYHTKKKSKLNMRRRRLLDH